MATVKAANITNLDATPRVAVSARLHGATTRTVVDTVSLTPAASDIILLARIPVEATLLSVKVASDDLASTSGNMKLGFYTATTASGVAGTVLDEDAIATTIDISGALGMTEYRFDTLAIETIQQPVWDLATLTARPEYDYIDVVATISAISGPLAGDVSCIVEYAEASN